MAGYDKRMERDHSPGWVYLITFPMVGGVGGLFCKIGLSRQPFKRLNQLKNEEWATGCAIIAAAFWTDDMAADETHLIEAYQKYKTNDGNEYFKMSFDVLADFIYTAHCLAREANYREIKRNAAAKNVITIAK